MMKGSCCLLDMMKNIVKKINRALIVSIFIIVCVLLFAPNLLEKPYIYKEITDFSLSHGDGYTLDENTIGIIGKNPYFILDLGNMKDEYDSVYLKFASEIRTDAEFDFYCSNNGFMKDATMVEGIIGEDLKTIYFEGDFENCQYIKISMNLPVGEEVSVKSLEVEAEKFCLDRVFLLFLGIMFIVGFIFIKCGIDEVIYDNTEHQRKFFKVWFRKSRDFVNKYIIAITFVIQFGVLVYFIVSGHLMYALNDDTLKVTLAGGGNGTPSEYLGFNTIHILLGKMFKILFSKFPIVNWITVFYLLVESISFVIMHLLLFHQGIRNNTFLRFCYAIVSLHFSCAWNTLHLQLLHIQQQ